MTVARFTTANHPCTTGKYGNDQSKEKADGTVSYTVQIGLKIKGVLVYQECQAFARTQVTQARYQDRRKSCPRTG